MKCPFCDNEMQSGKITGDGRSKVHWIPEGDKPGILESMIGKGRIDAEYTLTKFSIEANYCGQCKKMIFDTEISD